MALTKYREDPSGRYRNKGSICNGGADYGVSGITHGLDINPCIPCPPNLVTIAGRGYGDATWGFTDPAACVTPPGYGYNGMGGEPCPLGTWSSGYDTNPCTPCEAGLTTLSTGATSAAACVVAPGFGVFEDGNVQQCPKGTYSAGGLPDSTCIPCPFNSQSRDAGAVSVSQCNCK
jgi:hypothetical protein